MTKPVVLIAEKLSDATVGELGPDFEVRYCDGSDRDELLKALPGASAVLIRSATKMDEEAISAAADLRVIARAGVGLDNVDIPAATKAGVMVVNAPTSNITSAAEMTMAHILGAARNYGEGNRSLKAGEWRRSALTGVELNEKTLGIVGLGRIGGLVAERARSFGMNLIGYDPYISQARAGQMGVEAVSLDELLERADFITVHMPKTEETIGMIGREAFKKTKPGVRVINVARGGIVDEEALYEAVKDGRVAAAGIDVWSTEPPVDNPLLELPAVNVTPHLGASTAEAQEKAGIAVARSVRRAMAGELVPDAVNVAGGAIHEDVRPGIILAERLGRVLTALIDEPLAHLRVEVHGEIGDLDVSVLKLSALKGVFTDIVSTPVTYVNAPVLAEERGVTTELVSDTNSERYRNITSIIATTASGKKMSVSGTVTGPKLMQKLTEVAGFDLEIQLSDNLVIFEYEDRAGVIGQLGQALGRSSINIAGMQVARTDSGGHALAVLDVDSPVGDEVAEAVAGAIDASAFASVRLGE